MTALGLQFDVMVYFAADENIKRSVLGRLGFIGVAQSAGFKLREIKQLVAGMDAHDGMAEQMRSLSSQKLDEVEALLERTRAMKGWLEVATRCGCATPEECSLFPADGSPLPILVHGKDCRRAAG